MNKVIAFIIPSNIQQGNPAHQRITSFKQYFETQGHKVETIEQPQAKSLIQKFKLLRQLKAYKNILITMPPFRTWEAFLFLPKTNIILDIRDGWSIAMKSGYGGISKPSPVKHFFAKKIEQLAIAKSKLIITCTPGLKSYFEGLTDKQVVLIPNGYSTSDEATVTHLTNHMKSYNKHRTEGLERPVKAICLGKFSEYGKEKAIEVIRKLSLTFRSDYIEVLLVGASPKENNWIMDWLISSGLSRIRIEITPRVERTEMFSILLSSDVGLVVVRDPSYEFGTKIYDYILARKPIVISGHENSVLAEHFFDYMSSPATSNIEVFRRENCLARAGNELLSSLKQ